jgi:hypothetical protein
MRSLNAKTQKMVLSTLNKMPNGAECVSEKLIVNKKSTIRNCLAISTPAAYLPPSLHPASPLGQPLFSHRYPLQPLLDHALRLCLGQPAGVGPQGHVAPRSRAFFQVCSGKAALAGLQSPRSPRRSNPAQPFQQTCR